MAAAKNGDTIHIHYTGTLEDGTVFDSTTERGPMTLTLGDAETLQFFEHGIVGMEAGEQKTIDIPCRQAFGVYRKNMIRVLRSDTLPKPEGVKVGDRLRINTGDGKETIVKVKKIVGEELMIDMNHPLAGHDLRFVIDLLEIRSS